MTKNLRFARWLRKYLIESPIEQVPPKTSTVIHIDSTGTFAPAQRSIAKMIKMHRNDNTIVAFGLLFRGRIEN
jgi:hypothetical protein